MSEALKNARDLVDEQGELLMSAETILMNELPATLERYSFYEEAQKRVNNPGRFARWLDKHF